MGSLALCLAVAVLTSPAKKLPRKEHWGVIRVRKLIPMLIRIRIWCVPLLWLKEKLIYWPVLSSVSVFLLYRVWYFQVIRYVQSFSPALSFHINVLLFIIFVAMQMSRIAISSLLVYVMYLLQLRSGHVLRNNLSNFRVSNFVQGRILDHVINRATALFRRDVLLLVAFSFFTGLFEAVRNLCFAVVGKRVLKTLQDKLFMGIIIQDIAYFDGTTSGEVGVLPSTWDYWMPERKK